MLQTVKHSAMALLFCPLMPLIGRSWRKIGFIGVGVLTCLMIYALNIFGHVPATAAPVSRSGVIDLSQWQGDPQMPVNLNGHWKFYWQQLLTPQQLKASKQTAMEVYVPGYWTGQQINGKPLPNEGHGTYTLVLKGLKSQQYALMVPTTYTANAIWLDDKLVAKSGTVGENAKQTESRWQAHEVFFSATGKPIRITIQMATYDHPHFDGGITRAITLGTAEQVHYLRLKASITDFATAMIFLVLGFYQLVVYWQRPVDRVPLYFAGFSILMAFGALLTRNSFLYLHWFDFDFSIYQRLIYICQSFIAILFVKYVDGMFPNTCNKKVVRGLLYPTVLYFVLMQILTPNEPYFSRQLFSVVMAATLLYAIFCVVLAVRDQQKNARVFLLGIFCTTVSHLYEILLANDIVHPLYFNKDGPIAFAVIVFVLTQTYILATRHSDTLTEKAEIEEVNLEKNRFFAAASHDLRQPVYALQLLHNVLAAQDLPNQTRQIIKDIDKNTGQLENLIESLLQIAQIDQSGLKTDIKPLSMPSFLADVACEYAIQAKAKGLDFDVVTSTIYGRSDRKLLSRIVGNFLSNAIRYTPQGKIRLSCRQVEQGVIIEVSDTGPGITEDQQAAIFKEFYQLKQLNQVTACEDKGLGLGLSIVKRLATVLEYPIDVCSAPGKGAMFSVTIPPCQPIDKAPVKKAPVAKPRSQQQIQSSTVVILEDDIKVLNALKRQLDVWGFDTVTATDSGSLTSQLDLAQQPCLILSDYRLANDDNGIEVIGLIRRLYSAQIPAIITTGERHADTLAHIEQFDCVLCHKPIKPSELYQLVCQQISPP
ncbi:MAG: response regulator [Algicola sp.]|nr:response regulator [Algicola sp.]